MLERVRRAGQVSWAVVGIAALVTLLGVIVWYFRVILPPLLLAGAIVFILNPVVTFLQRRGLPRALGTGIAYVGVVAIAVGIGFLVAPIVRDQWDELVDDLPEIRDDIVDRWNELAENWPIPTLDEVEEEIGSGGGGLGEQAELALSVGESLLRFLLIVVLTPIIAFYLLVDVPHLRRVAESLIPERARPEVMVVASRLNRAIGGFFRGQLVVALIVGTLVSIGLAIIDLPFWLIIGMIAGFFNMIPLVGPYIGAIPGVVVALTTRDLRTAILVVVVMVIAQQIDNHFITPYVMQRAVKVHPVLVILALLAGGFLFGFFGLLLAVPAAATLKILVGHVWRTHVLGEPLEQVVATEVAADARKGVGVVARVGEDEEDDTAAEAQAETPVDATGAAETTAEAEAEVVTPEPPAESFPEEPEVRAPEPPGGDGAPGTRVIRDRR
jgi:predicted PurR-regulated permease PerM